MPLYIAHNIIGKRLFRVLCLFADGDLTIVEQDCRRSGVVAFTVVDDGRQAIVSENRDR